MIQIEILNTGAELLLGRVVNTHAQWLCRQLSQLGYGVTRQVTVDDTAPLIQQAVREALGRADVLITTGGLGPTSDDLTRDCIAQLLGKRLVLDTTVLTAIEQFYAVRGRTILESTKVQAYAPEGSMVLPNRHGTAPGLIIEVAAGLFRAAQRPSWLIMLPGPPRELYPMFIEQVLPWLQQRLHNDQPPLMRIFRTTGLGESGIEEKIGEPLKPLLGKGLELGYCARVGEVEVRLSARGASAARALAEGETIVNRLLGPYIFSLNDETMENVIVKLLLERKQTMALAESCTGGYIGHRITNVPGASGVLMADLVTYSNEAKQKLLGVPAEMIRVEGAVSAAVAKAMAEGARRRMHTDYGLSVTGIAGPSGGSEAKPVGTVFIGLASANEISVQHQVNRLDRESFKQASSQQALEMLRETLVANP